MIQVVMLGRFDLLIDGNSVFPFAGNSQKSVLLLKYLILQQHRPVSAADLIDMFWTESDKSSNPESALKTMISRIRSSMAKAHDSLRNCIISERKSYQWNNALPCQLDVFDFEQLCHFVRQTDQSEFQIRMAYEQILHLYKGDMVCSGSGENWLFTRSLYLHNLYLEVVYRYLELLRKSEENDRIIDVCRTALEIDYFDERLNLELMKALRENGQNNAALMQYRHITGAYHKYLGIRPSEMIINFYRDLVQIEQSCESDLQTIHTSLYQHANSDGGALVCDYSVFEDIYQLHLRNLERQEYQTLLMLITVEPVQAESEPLYFNSVMRDLVLILKKCLRKGDVISRYSPSQYALLLPVPDDDGRNVIITRIRGEFSLLHSGDSIYLDIQIDTLKPAWLTELREHNLFLNS